MTLEACEDCGDTFEEEDLDENKLCVECVEDIGVAQDEEDESEGCRDCGEEGEFLSDEGYCLRHALIDLSEAHTCVNCGCQEFTSDRGLCHFCDHVQGGN